MSALHLARRVRPNEHEWCPYVHYCRRCGAGLDDVEGEQASAECPSALNVVSLRWSKAYQHAMAVADEVLKRMQGSRVPGTHADVLALLDRVVERMERE